MAGKLAPDGANLLLGRGKIYFSKRTAGALEGELDLGNCEAFTVTPTGDTKEKWSSQDAASNLLAYARIHNGFEIKITGSEFSFENLGLVLMGSAGSIVQTGAAVTGEALAASAKQGRWYPTVKRNITAVTVLVATKTPVVDVDYRIDASGRIFVIPGSLQILEGATVTVNYTYATASLRTVKMGDTPKVEGFLRFVGDPAAGPTYEGEFWNVALNPSGDLSLIGDDYGNFSLHGRTLADTANHPTEPYGRVIER